MDDVESVVEVLPKRALRDGRDIAIGRGDQSRIEVRVLPRRS